MMRSGIGRGEWVVNSYQGVGGETWGGYYLIVFFNCAFVFCYLLSSLCLFYVTRTLWLLCLFLCLLIVFFVSVPIN